MQAKSRGVTMALATGALVSAFVVSGCSRSELSPSGDLQRWQVEYPCATQRTPLGPGGINGQFTEDLNQWASPCGVVQSAEDVTVLWQAPQAGVWQVTASLTQGSATVFVLRNSCSSDVPACDAVNPTGTVEFDVAEGESVLVVIDADVDDAVDLVGDWRLVANRIR